MSAAKPPAVQSPMPFTAISTKQGLILILSTLTLLTFSYVSLSSLGSTLQPVYPPLTTTVSTVSTFKEDADLEDDSNRKSGEFSDVYHTPDVFRLNYAEMEKRFRVYIYPDGDPKTFYQTPRKLTGKYASEGYFFQNIRESRFRTEDPDQAHLFFIPISCHKMRGKEVAWHQMFGLGNI